ncbi:MAG: amino acid adenylation domain-containing protein, partial [Thermoanaerobaculia bacterium]
REIPLRALLQGQTAEDLARTLAALWSEETARLAPPVGRVPRSGLLPLSFAQERLWFLDRLVPGNATYNSPLAARLAGPLEIGLLTGALNEVVRRHEALRTTFAEVDGRAVQVISPHLVLVVPAADLRALPEERREEEMRRLIRGEASRPFDLERGPLLRMTVLAVAPEEHVMLLTMHHIASDGWSTGVLVRELAALLPALAEGRPSPLPKLPLQYADFAVWQRRWFSGEVLAREAAWWRDRLAGAPGVLELPTDRPRPAEQTFRGATERTVLPPELVRGLGAVARRHNATTFMILLAALDALLLRTSGQADIAVGTAIAGRTRPEIEGLIGFFANTVVLRVDAGGDPAFPELLDRVRESALGAYAHQEIPFERLVEELQPRRDLSRSPLFQVMFALQSAEALELPGLRLELLPVDTGTAKFDLTWMLVEDGDRITVDLEHNRDLFESATIQRALRHWRVLLAGVAAGAERRLSEMPWLDEGERHQLLLGWNDTAAPAAAGSWIQRGFEARAAASPGAPAVLRGDEALSYGELDAQANRLARHLRALGIEPGDLVGIGLDRSLDLIVGLLAVLKAGAGYVPLDPGHPRERLAYMLRDSGARLVLTRSDLGLPFGTEVRVLRLDRERDAIAALPRAAPPRPPLPVGFAYVIYTSGSTGLPKGVMLRHEPVVNLIDWVNGTFGVGPGDRMLFVTSPSFDLSVYDVFGILAAGGTLRVATSADLRDPEELVRLLREDGITFWDSAPAALQQLTPLFGERRDGALRLVFLSGDWIPVRLPERVRKAFPGARVIALGGATEAAIWSNSFAVETVPSWWPSIPYGRPIRNARYLILDPWLEPCPAGVPGDLYIGGGCLAAGYAPAPELTASRFLPDPWPDEPGGRLYRTGDRARFLPDGNIEFLGRLDTQVKIRGFRIELGEIEAALTRHPAVREAVVSTREDAATGKRLVACVVPRSGAAPSPRELRDFLQRSLPEPMVPSSFVLREALPLTPNGKVDRAALPRLDAVTERGEDGFAPPSTPVEETLAAIWAETLGLPRVGIHDNFFELGGDSILSIQVVARARRAGLLLTARQLFQNQTIAALAAAAGSAGDMDTEGAVEGEAPLTPIQRRFFAEGRREPWRFNQAVLLASRERLDRPVLAAALDRLARHHDALRLRFVRKEDGWHQVHAPATPVPLLEVDLPPEALEAAIEQLQSGLDLEDGPLFTAALFHLGEEDRLLLTAHHLIVDGVSWRVLLEDLVADELPPKTTSWKRWAELLAAHSSEEEIPWWSALPAVPPLPVDLQGDGGMATVSVEWGREETRSLLQGTPYRTQVNDLLLAAIARAFAAWTGERTLLVDLEGHGREEIFPGVDLSRTVGWFTTLVPVALTLPPGAGPRESILAVKETLRAVPRRGIGYGLLQERLSVPRPQVSFNYLGRFEAPADGPFAFAPETVRGTEGEAVPGRRLFAVDLLVLEDRLRVNWTWDPGRHLPATVERLAQGFLAELATLVGHCLSPEAGGYTPSDFPLAGLDRTALDRLGPGIEDLYPLSPLQEGLLFHSLYREGDDPYFEQLTATLEGPLDAPAFAAAWQRTVDRHTALRTGFLWQEVDRPLQLVRSRAELPWSVVDWRGEAGWQELLAADRARGFDLSDLGRPPLMRLTLVRRSEDRHRLIWSFHHLVFDGWCLPVILAEVFAAYQDPGVRLLPARPSRDYIAWLAQRDETEAEHHWRETLRGFAEPTSIPFDRAAGAGDACERSLSLPLPEQRLQVTLNTLVQGAWALLLSRYSGAADVVFGAVVSGRPPELPGVESIVGLFINTVPVRAAIPEDGPASAWLSRLQSEQLGLRQHQWTPLSRVQALSEVPAGEPLFSSLLAFENYPVDPSVLQLGELRIVDAALGERTNYPLTLTVVARGDLSLRLTADPRFELATVERLLGHLGNLLNALAADPGRPPRELPMLSEGELRQVLVDWNETASAFPAASIPELFAEQAALHPDSVAVEQGDERLTYRELQERAGRVARR